MKFMLTQCLVIIPTWSVTILRGWKMTTWSFRMNTAMVSMRTNNDGERDGLVSLQKKISASSL